MDNVFGSAGIPSVNLNVPALVLGGGLVIASTFLLPLLFKTYAHHPPLDRYAKILEHTQFGADGVLDFANNVLSGGVEGCALRVACWSGQRDHEDEAKFWTGMMSNQLVSTLVNSTAVEDAIASGRRGRDCSVYSPCPLSAQHYPMLMKHLMQLSNTIS
ncbi:uncharacterized protein LOC125232559 [Leguminivora glycinivorella]|uniref:uncharacterized protein LOC125232559 n=1 Tax=Leguminivora glycinivorella TaxID=1035111 RepID=UPI00200CC8C8|nr:uncharacterized protein LOC125232559 [Leguminivora glycinivorella]XP_047994230.1 uncharacterized protein LOC125232559 [Leguminivora glycinivorella]XP_047994231.1 uncharacterized protein LOC125232559 [Leguminivora glycinivorella]XP_047994232.1 uncharacterized protein LOC125232559 [Leguminivora glycinivorella]XP_047994233.1 uncharacterized protein LOC125232559 [Leguminivora glycinivorella]